MLLFGCCMYDIFVLYWLFYIEGEFGDIGNLFNWVLKYVVICDVDIVFDWVGSMWVGGNFVVEIVELWVMYCEVYVIGSFDFVYMFFVEGLFDELNFWVYLLLFGVGKKVFDDGVLFVVLWLFEFVVMDDVGVIFFCYGWMEWVLEVGMFG